jgi:MYXO-CTERM domain-containing protein
MRDDFPRPVVETLAKRVGNRCSNPTCRKRTSGPHTDNDKALNVGVAVAALAGLGALWRRRNSVAP